MEKIGTLQKRIIPIASSFFEQFFFIGLIFIYLLKYYIYKLFIPFVVNIGKEYIKKGN